MPPTISEQIAELERALSVPEQEVESGGHRIRYRSVDELLRALNELRSLQQREMEAGRMRRVVRVMAQKDL